MGTLDFLKAFKNKVLLGHKTMTMTDDYTELDLKKAAEVAKVVG